MKLLTIALGLLLTANVSAANIESVFLPSDSNKCIRSLELPLSIHTERIEKDLLGSVYVNPFRNVENMIYGNNAENVPCAKRVLEFIRLSNAFYQDYGVYFVFGRKDGTEALNRLNYFESQGEFAHGGL